jgi:multiple sugar transport system ATP-binding protein
VQITARLAAESRVRQGAESELWFDSTHLHLFDAESGRSLLARDGAVQDAQAPATSGTQSSG